MLRRVKRGMMFVSAETKQKREDAFHADINIKRDDDHEDTQAESAQVSGPSDDPTSFVKRQVLSSSSHMTDGQTQEG